MNISLSMVLMAQQILFVFVEVTLNRKIIFILHCPEYYEARQTLFDNIQSINEMLLKQSEFSLTQSLL